MRFGFAPLIILVFFRVFRVFRGCLARWNEFEWRLAAGRFPAKFGPNQDRKCHQILV